MSFQKPLTEIIPTRFSCRTYLKRPIKTEVRERLAEIAAKADRGPLGSPTRFEVTAASPGDSQALRGLGTYGFIKGATGFIIGTTQNRDRNLEDFGYLMEKIILHATDFGLGTCWLGGTFTKSKFAKVIAATSDEIIPAVTSVGYIAEKTRWFDQTIRNTAGSDHRLPWERLFFNERLGTPLSPDNAREYTTPLEMVRIGPSASNRQPWRIVKVGSTWHFYLMRTIGYRQSNSAKLLKIEDLQRVDMGIAMCHFELTAREMGLNGQWAVLEPEIYIPGEEIEYTVSWVG